MKGFCYMYSLQVGLAIIAACGLALTTTCLLVNVARTAHRGGEYQSDSLGKSAAQYFLFLTFVILGYVTYVFVLMGAYKEEIKPLKVAMWAMLIQFILWLVLTILSLIPVKTHEWTCVHGMRCADRFFIHTYYFHKGQGNPVFEYRTDETPSKVFNNELDCLNYCKPTKTKDHQEYRRQADSEAENMTTTIPRSETYASTNTGPSIDTSINTTESNPLGTVNSTQPSSPRNGSCTCSKEEKKFNTLVGTADSIGHLILSIVFTLVIAIVWYLYSICILRSYINFLKLPPRGSRATKTSI